MIKGSQKGNTGFFFEEKHEIRDIWPMVLLLMSFHPRSGMQQNARTPRLQDASPSPLSVEMANSECFTILRFRAGCFLTLAARGVELKLYC